MSNDLKIDIESLTDQRELAMIIAVASRRLLSLTAGEEDIWIPTEKDKADIDRIRAEIRSGKMKTSPYSELKEKWKART